MPNEEVVRAKISSALKPQYLEVEDFSDGCGAKFNVIVVSSLFEGKALLQRHRLVNDSLSEEMSQIHALTMKTYTPAQWENINSSKTS